MPPAAVPLLLLALAALPAAAQERRPGFAGGGEIFVPEDIQTARAVPSRSTGFPDWTNAPAFARDVFTFARVRYEKSPDRARRGSGGWTTDLPDADLNLSYRLQQMTALRVDPDGRLLRLTDAALRDHPFIFISAPGSLNLREDEVPALRRYLLNGGFLLMDDFWGEREWANCEAVFRQVFPDRHFFELPLDHPLYRGAFTITAKGQVPNVRLGIASEQTGITWEREDARTVHHRGLADDRGRLMVLALHNTDTADGWEREGESDYYFHTFSEKIAYPLGVNIILYVMTH